MFKQTELKCLKKTTSKKKFSKETTTQVKCFKKEITTTTVKCFKKTTTAIGQRKWRWDDKRGLSFLWPFKYTRHFGTFLSNSKEKQK